MDGREKLIKEYIEGKDVLDLGVGDIRDRFLHKFVKENSNYTIGVELDKKRATELMKRGYNIVLGNAETVELKRKFDVVLAGDIIEHLDNPGIFLENVKKHLKKDGIFICNTPNIYSINLLLRGFVLGGNVKHLNEHTVGFTEQLIRELYSRHNLSIKKVIYFCHKEKNLGSIFVRVTSSLSRKWKENMLIIAKKK